MSEEWSIPTPPFKAEEALVSMRRRLRELKLAEHGSSGAFDLRGKPVVTLALDGDAIAARVVKRPARAPEWSSQRLGSAAEVRRFLDTLARQVEAWGDSGE